MAFQLPDLPFAKDALAPQAMFEDLGLKYIGPVDGHDLAERAAGVVADEHDVVEVERLDEADDAVWVAVSHGSFVATARSERESRFLEGSTSRTQPCTGVPIATSGSPALMPCGSCETWTRPSRPGSTSTK